MVLNKFRDIPLVWDRANSRFLDTLELNASDENGRKLTVQVLDDGQVVNLAGANLSLYWESNGKQYKGLDGFTPIDPSKGLFELFFTTGMLSNIGKITGWLRLQDATGVTISSPLTFHVGRGIDNTAIESHNSFTVLTEALNRVVTIEFGETRRNNEFNAAQTNRMNDYNSKEQARQNQFNQAENRRALDYAPQVNENKNAIVAQTNEMNRVTDALSGMKAETGNNTNGGWLKRPDGTMLCWVTSTISGPPKGDWGTLKYWEVRLREWDFPQPFIEKPKINFSHSGAQFNFSYTRLSATKLFGIDATRPVTYDGDTVDVTIFAEGRWSAVADGSFFKGADYPSYWNAHLANKIGEVSSLQNQSLDAHSFVFITDMHMESNEGYSFSLVRKVVNDLQLQTVINGGDQANNTLEASKERTLVQIKEMLDGFTPIHPKLMNVMGNHDDNSISRNWNKIIMPPELHKRLFQFMGNNSVYGESGKYHYRDNVFQKTRYIVLDSIDIPYIRNGNDVVHRGIHHFAFRQAQLDWFANVALRTPPSWSVVVVSHVPPWGQGVVGMDEVHNNAELARGILKAYKNKTTYTGSSIASTHSDFKANVSVDFTNRGGDVLVWLAGHVHYDNVVTMPEGIKLVTTINDTCRNWESTAPRFVAGTISEQAFDIITVNKAQRKMYLTRVGAGSDRIVNY